MRGNKEAIHGTRAGTNPMVGKKPAVYSSSIVRTCPKDGCGKVLSQYNKGPFCYTHQPHKPARVRGRFT